MPVASTSEIGAVGVRHEEQVAKVSIVGLGMRTHAGVAARMFRVLADERINIEMIATSEIKVSVVVNAKYGELAMRALHDAFLGERFQRGTGGVGLKQMAVAKKIQIYDTTLRDGCQSEDVSLTVEDKLEIAERLDDLGIDYIEGGWPGSNERDAAFFREVKKLRLRHSKIAAFGSTRRANVRPRRTATWSCCFVPRLRSRPWSARPGTCTCARRCAFPTEANLDILHDTIAYLKSTLTR